MIALLANLGLVAFLVVSLIVGLRLLALWHRTRGLPELLVGAAFVVGGVVGFVPEHLVLKGLVPPPWDGVVLIVANVATRTTAVLCAVFTWQVFRRGERWAGGLVVVLAALLALGFATHPGPWVTVETPLEWASAIATAFVRSFAFAWAAWEALREARMARRRVGLGLLPPQVARRFLLWGVAMAGPAGMSAIPLLNRWLLMPDPGPPVVWMLGQSLLGLIAAGGMAAAFLAPTFGRADLAASKPAG